MQKIIFFLVALGFSLSGYAQPWVRVFRASEKSNIVLYNQKFIETYDHGIALLFSTNKEVVLYKLDRNGNILQRKTILLSSASSYHLNCGGFVEDTDRGLLISGTISENTRWRAFRMKLDPCFGLDYLALSEDSADGGAYDAVPYSDYLIESVITVDMMLPIRSPVKLNLLDRATRSLLKSREFLTYNDPYIDNIRKVKNGFVIIGAAYFEDSLLPPDGQFLHSYLLYLDSGLNLLKQHVFYNDHLHFSSGSDIEYADGYFYVLNYVKVKPSPLYNQEIVKIKEDFTTFERFGIPEKDTIIGFHMRRIGGHLYTASQYAREVKKNEEVRTVLCKFDLASKEYTTLVVDSTHNQFSYGLIKTFDDKLIFIGGRVTGRQDPDFVLYKYRPDLLPDSFTTTDPFTYNFACQQNMNDSSLILKVGDFYTTGFTEINDEKVAVSVYPNPASDVLSITSSSSRGLTLRLYDMTGKFVLEKKLREPTENMDISRLKAGSYYIQVKNAEELIHLQKILVIE